MLKIRALLNLTKKNLRVSMEQTEAERDYLDNESKSSSDFFIQCFFKKIVQNVSFQKNSIQKFKH